MTVKAFGIAGYELSLQERVAQLVEMVGGQTRAAEIANVSRNAIHKWRTGQSRVPLEEMLELAKAAGVSMDWVSTGYDRRPDMGSGPAKEFAVIYRYEAAPSGALVEITDHGGDIAFRAEWLKSIHIEPTKAALLIVRGDAMAPTIGDGTTVIVDRSVMRISGGGLYALLHGSEVAVRRIQVLVDGALKLLADNPRYEPELVSASAAGSLKIAGRVRAAIVTL